MSQESLQQPSRLFAPWQPPQSNDSFMPPAKRQRIDSAPSSPYAQSPQSPFVPSPNFSNITLPNGYHPQRQLNGTSTTPQAIGAQRLGQSVMGPPQRPADRPADRQEEKPERHLDVNELSDLVTASGIDLREEENYLAASYRADRNNASLTGQPTSTASSQNRFDLLSQTSFGAIGSQRASAQFRPEGGPTPEQELYEKHKRAARAVNESQQHHLQKPFLEGNAMRQRMQKVAADLGVRVPLDGLFDRVAEKPQSISGSSMTGADGSSMVVATAPSVLNRGTPLEPMLCLLSLAANERVRGLLEDAYGLARGRHFSSDGVVPPEWSDLAVARDAQSTTVVPQSISQTSWDVVETARPERIGVAKDGQQALLSPPSSPKESDREELPAQPTVAMPKSTSITRALTDLARRDRAAEVARQKLRAARASKKTAQAAAAATFTPDSTDGGVTPTGDGKKLPVGMIGERAPEVKMTKKEREKLAKQDISDEVATRNANSTASMQLGGLGKSYSWMKSGGGKGKASAPVRTPGRPGTAGGPGVAGGGVKGQPEGWPAQDRTFGEWREDGVSGKGIHLRDWVGVLEMDGKERASLGWALMKLGD